MAENSAIQWTDATWNPITGCTLVSEGCRFCYAALLAATRLKNHPSRKGLARINAKGEAKFTGEVRFNDQWLGQPLRWKRPRMIFVCAHGDLFHENVPDEWIDRVFAVMALCPQHTFQVLTKRPERMRAYLASGSTINRVGEAMRGLAPKPSMSIADAMERFGHPTEPHQKWWPLPNVWLGTSVEDQATADERIPVLLEVPAAVRFLSCEPLLKPIDLTIDGLIFEDCPSDCENRMTDWSTGVIECRSCEDTFKTDDASIDWVIVGGESGPNARIWGGFTDAARSLRDQCQSAGVPFFMKQTQGKAKKSMPPIPDDLMIREFPASAAGGKDDRPSPEGRVPAGPDGGHAVSAVDAARQGDKPS